MKKLMAIVSALIIVTMLFCVPASAAAKTLTADPNGLGDGVVQKATGGNLLFMTIGFVDEHDLQTAYNIQSIEQIKAAGLSTALYTATQENFYINGISLKDYAIMSGSEYIFMVHFERYGNRTFLVVFWDPAAVPGCTLEDTIVFGVADGFISKEMYKVNPFTATWNPAAGQLIVEQGFEPPAPTTTTTKTPTTTTQAPATTTTEASTTTTEASGDSDTTTLSQNDDPNNTSSNGTNATTMPVQGGDQGGISPIIIVLIIAIAVIVIGAGIAIFCVLRGKNDTSEQPKA